MSRNEPKYPLTCVICGNKFLGIRPNATTCSPECRKIANANRVREKRKAAKRKSANLSLDQIIHDAKEHGMSYGQYRAALDSAIYKGGTEDEDSNKAKSR